MSKDLNQYIGIPWVKGGHSLQGADCWGLVLLIQAGVHGVVIQRHKGAKAAGDDLAEIIEGEEGNGVWVECGPEDGAVVVMDSKITGRPEHVGVYIAGEGVLHSVAATANGHSSIAPLRVILRAFKAVRFYRYAIDSN